MIMFKKKLLININYINTNKDKKTLKLLIF